MEVQYTKACIKAAKYENTQILYKYFTQQLTPLWIHMSTKTVCIVTYVHSAGASISQRSAYSCSMVTRFIDLRNKCRFKVYFRISYIYKVFLFQMRTFSKYLQIYLNIIDQKMTILWTGNVFVYNVTKPKWKDFLQIWRWVSNLFFNKHFIHIKLYVCTAWMYLFHYKGQGVYRHRHYINIHRQQLYRISILHPWRNIYIFTQKHIQIISTKQSAYPLVNVTSQRTA